MRRKLLYLMAGVAVIAAGCLFASNAEAKYAESKGLTLTVNIEKHYEVEFDANGGTGTMVNQQFTAGESQTLTANTYTRDGYYFVGWNRVATGGTTGDYYDDQAMIDTDLTNLGGSVVTLYAQWEENAMHTVFQIEGDCVFHGYDMATNPAAGYITGSSCTYDGTNWADGTHRYIDTGIQLYDEDNYEKDYEIGFTITNYDPNRQYKGPGETSIQSTFMNTKFENEDRHWPGLAVRKSSNKIELVQTINYGNTFEKKTATTNATSEVKVVIARMNGVVYYSFNSGEFTALQDMNDTSDYFDTPVWFGAAENENGGPMRYVDATLSDIYIKVGDKGSNGRTVNFDAHGVVANPASATVVAGGKIGSKLPSMPSYVDTAEGRKYFHGWYSGVDGSGTRYTESSIIENDITLHANWVSDLAVCSIGGVGYDVFTDCITAAASDPSHRITLLDDLSDQFTIASGEEIILDLNGYTLSDKNTAGQPVIANNGKLTIMNGTLTSSLKAGVINNNSTGELHVMSGTRIVATGLRQAIYNDGGYLEIEDGAYLSAVSTERATLQILNNGRAVVKGGTIISEKQEAIKVDSGSLVIGVEDGVISSGTPVIQGATNGVTANANISMFDGILRGKNAAINNTSRITSTEVGATAVGINPVATEVIDGVTYKVLYYQ